MYLLEVIPWLVAELGPKKKNPRLSGLKAHGFSPQPSVMFPKK